MRRPAALITGAAKGIGRQITLTLAEKGYDVAVNYHTDQNAAEEVCREAESFGGRAVAVYADMSQIKDIKDMYSQADQAFEGIDLVVNNAGISSEVYFLEAEEADFDRMTAIDWKGLFFSSQEAAKRMIGRGTKGVIINISSNQVDGCWPRAAIYGPTKAAVSKFTKNAAMELAGYGIRMAAVAPGYTDVGWAPDDIRWEAAARLPFGLFASTREIAEAVAYLASPQAAYITGTTLTVDGGATLPVVAANDFV
ncbi:MAG: SDR family oxidoreductase [Clostridium sp.]|nr:SDR family oxidoreductase [Clostridium sp.]